MGVGSDGGGSIDGGGPSGGGDSIDGGDPSGSQKMKSPEQLRPFPKAPPRKNTTNRRQGKSRILTTTPIT